MGLSAECLAVLLESGSETMETAEYIARGLDAVILYVSIFPYHALVGFFGLIAIGFGFGRTLKK